jgi:hypothetical protein
MTVLLIFVNKSIQNHLKAKKTGETRREKISFFSAKKIKIEFALDNKAFLILSFRCKH